MVPDLQSYTTITGRPFPPVLQIVKCFSFSILNFVFLVSPRSLFLLGSSRKTVLQYDPHTKKILGGDRQTYLLYQRELLKCFWHWIYVVILLPKWPLHDHGKLSNVQLFLPNRNRAKASDSHFILSSFSQLKADCVCIFLRLYILLPFEWSSTFFIRLLCTVPSITSFPHCNQNTHILCLMCVTLD